MSLAASKIPLVHRALAVVVLAGVLLASVLAVLPRAHDEIHCAAHEPEHVCAVTLFAHGHVEMGDGFVPIITLGAPLELSVFSRSVPAFAAGVAFLQPARGPPASV